MKHLHREVHYILNSGSRRLSRDPQLKIVWPVIQTYLVLVVDVLTWQQGSTQLLYHHKAVFRDRPFGILGIGVSRPSHVAIACDDSPRAFRSEFLDGARQNSSSYESLVVGLAVALAVCSSTAFWDLTQQTHIDLVRAQWFLQVAPTQPSCVMCPAKASITSLVRTIPYRTPLRIWLGARGRAKRGIEGQTLPYPVEMRPTVISGLIQGLSPTIWNAARLHTASVPHLHANPNDGASHYLEV